MGQILGRLPEEGTNLRIDQITAALRRLERRDWWLWATAIIVTLLLTGAVISLSLPVSPKEGDRFDRFNLEQAVRGLVGLVLLSSIYTVYQQLLIKRLRRKLAEEMVTQAGLRMRAEEFHRIATLDPLTGLYNDRLLDRRLAAEINRCRRYSYPLTVLLLEVNGFDQILESAGQSAGNEVLKEFAERLIQSIRICDVAVSLGGGHFLILLPECPPEQVESLLKRLGPLEVNLSGTKIPVKFSAGWAGYRRGELPEELVSRARRALRVQVEASAPDAAPAKELL